MISTDFDDEGGCSVVCLRTVIQVRPTFPFFEKKNTEVPNRCSALLTLRTEMQGSNDQQRRRADMIDQRIVDVLKRMPEHEGPWSTILRLTGLANMQLSRGLKRLELNGIMERRVIWIRERRSDVYHLRNPSLMRVFTRKRILPDMKTPHITSRKGFETVRDYGTWKHVSRLDQGPGPDLNKYSR